MRDFTVNLKNAAVEERARMESVPPSPAKKAKRRRPILLAYIVGAVIVAGYLWSLLSSGLAWRAVFLSNNQVYFGHFWDIPFASTITLHNVYYLQEVSQSGTQLSGQSQAPLKLVKLGNEIHGPTDEMVIPFSQVLFWETLRSDSAIVNTIKNGVQTSQ